MFYELMEQQENINPADVCDYYEWYNDWQDKVVEILCEEMEFDNKEVMKEAFVRSKDVCCYMSKGGYIDPKDVHDLVADFIEFYNRVTA